MKPSYSVIGFIAVAALIGVLEWHSGDQAASNELLVTEAQRAFVREQVLQTGVQATGGASYEQALANYIDEEILYREGVKLGLEKDDLIVKRRVVQKMRFLLEDMTPIAPPTQAQLQTWLDQNAQRYQTEQTILFDHYFFSRGKRGDEAFYQAGLARKNLISGIVVVADPFPLETGSELLGQERIAKEFGVATSNTIFELPLNEWSEPVNSSLGVHLFKVRQKNAGRTMTLEEAGEQLRSDLIAAQREAVNEASLAALRATYTIKEAP
ncbi:MAG: peptidyl-prolyl cis-trans isomerase [Burkholderiales bacterium]|jgi:peptidyl-prolyl cis-trans isomerase C|uniref:peptidylprolyl isomerase n=1 Tax=Limnobacter sp. TaxID=2003368 RepID=UPI0039BC9DCB|nr:peptidyl-prolyl cis-trans isomerase [Burkholderiales bacterium]